MKRRPGGAARAAGLAGLLALAGCGERGGSPGGVAAPKPASALDQLITAQELVNNPETLHARLREKNPAYRDEGRFAIDPALGLVGEFIEAPLADLTPLAGIPFAALDLRGSGVTNLAPLRGMPLRLLALEDTRVSDLAPLRGMPLERLYCNNAPVSDLRPLAGAPLREAMLVGTRVTSVEPLRGAPLEQLWLNDTGVDSVAPLAACPLVSLTLHRTPVADLAPLAGVRTLQRLHIAETNVKDLTPLRDLPLTRLIFTPARIQTGLDVARGLATLQEIGATLEGRRPPAEFWPLVDAGKAP